MPHYTFCFPPEFKAIIFKLINILIMKTITTKNNHNMFCLVIIVFIINVVREAFKESVTFDTLGVDPPQFCVTKCFNVF